MKKVNIHQAKTHLSQLLEAVIKGEIVIISKAGTPIAKLTPLDNPKAKPKFGVLKGKIKIAKDFDAPLSKDILDSFEGNKQ